MSLGTLLRRAGVASPLLPPLVYAAGLTVASVARALAPTYATVALLAFLVWAASLAWLVVVVTWYRADDWLAAGFLIGLGLLVSDLVAGAAASIAATHSIGAAVFAAAAAVLSVLLRALVLVPLCGALVALARWVTRRLRPPATPSAPTA